MHNATHGRCVRDPERAKKRATCAAARPTCRPFPMDATSTCVSVARMAAPCSLARSLSCASMMENTRSMPIDTPTAGTSLPLNMPTSLS
jgi:hypothetical protein